MESVTTGPSMKTSLRLPAAVIAIVVIGSGVVHGIWTDRWHTSGSSNELADRLNALPLEIGAWTGTDASLSDSDREMAELAGSVLRHYVSRETPEAATVLLMCGRPGPISVHPPTACYQGAGYRIEGNPRRHRVIRNDATAGTMSDTLFVADFRKPLSQGPGRVRIYWGWSDDGRWTAPDHPRMTFAGVPALCKLYVTHELSDVEPADVSDADPFLQMLLTEIRSTVFARRP